MNQDFGGGIIVTVAAIFIISLVFLAGSKDNSSDIFNDCNTFQKIKIYDKVFECKEITNEN